MKTLWHLVEFALAKCALAVMSLTPVSFALRFADTVGALTFVLLPARAGVAVENVRAAGIAPDEAAARRIARRSFQSFARMVAETFCARHRINEHNWTGFVTLEASPEARAMLANPRQGGIVASGHLGNWELAARAVSMIRPVSVIFRPMNNPYLNEELNSERGGGNLHLISKYKASPMRFIRLLANGDWLALMIDQHISEPNQRVRTRFFGRPCWTTRSVAMMHITTRMPLFVAMTARVGPMKFKIHLTGPIHCPRTGDREADVLVITQRLTDEIERVARLYPEQYLWGHRRWKD